MHSPPQWPPAQAPYPQAPPPGRKRFGRITALFLSFFSADLYRDVARNWRGIALLYLLLLCLLTWIPVLVKTHLGMRRAANDPEAAAVINQMPSITINKGVVSIKEPEPYLMKDPQTGQTLLYVDTSNRFDRPEAKQAVFLLGRSTLETRNQNKTQIHDLSQFPDVYVDKIIVGRWLDTFAKWFAVMALPLAMLGSLVWGLVRLLLYALIGLMFNSMFNARLDYAALMRLSAVAMTPAMVLDTVLIWLVGAPVPCCGSMFLAGAITLGYLAFAVKANAQPLVPPGMGPTYGFPMAPATAGYPQQPAYAQQPGYPPQPPAYPPGYPAPPAPPTAPPYNPPYPPGA